MKTSSINHCFEFFYIKLITSFDMPFKDKYMIRKNFCPTVLFVFSFSLTSNNKCFNSKRCWLRAFDSMLSLIVLLKKDWREDRAFKSRPIWSFNWKILYNKILWLFWFDIRSICFCCPLITFVLPLGFFNHFIGPKLSFKLKYLSTPSP